MLKRNRMVRQAESSLPWLGVRAFGFGGGFVFPSAPPKSLLSEIRTWTPVAGGGVVQLPPVALPAPVVEALRGRVEWVPNTWGGAYWVADGGRLRVWFRVGVKGGQWSAARAGEHPSHGHATPRAAAVWAMGSEPAEPPL